jgi:spermidine/putrescine transport system substrate-binding protein
MKKIFTFLLMLFFPLVLNAATNTLNIYNWSGYLPIKILQQFEKETGIQVNYSTYDSNETLYAKLKAVPDAGYDIIVPSSYFVDRMRKQNMLLPLDLKKIPNIANLNPSFLNRPFDPGNRYSIPYFWLATGIVYNDKYYKPGEIQHWSDLWKEKYKNELLLLNDVREVFSMALIALGYDANDSNPEHIKAAYLKLKQLLPNVKLFNAEAISSIYIDEDVTLGMGWSGETLLSHRENPHVKFIYPSEGFVLSLDSMAIPIGATHVENAYQFINFILRPDIAKALSEQTGYPTPNLSAIKLMSPSEMNPITYPDPEILAKGVFQVDLGDANSLYEKYWELLKIGG